MSLDEPVVGLDLNGDTDLLDTGVSTPVNLFKQNPTGNDLSYYPGYPMDY